MPKMKNETFWVIFKHCAYLEQRGVDLSIGNTNEIQCLLCHLDCKVRCLRIYTLNRLNTKIRKLI